MWQAWCDVLIGAWVAVAPFVPLDLSTVKFNNMIMGALAALASHLLRKKKSWERWVGMIFGTWVFIAACIPNLTTGSAYLWNNYGSGILIALAGIFAVRKYRVEITRLLDVPPAHHVDRRSPKDVDITQKVQNESK